MKQITDFILESISNKEYHAIHEVCLLIENVEKLTNDAVKIAKSLKDNNQINFENVVELPSIYKLSQDALSKAKMSVKSSEGKKELKNYVAAIVLGYYESYEIGTLPKDIQDKALEYDYAKINF